MSKLSHYRDFRALLQKHKQGKPKDPPATKDTLSKVVSADEQDGASPARENENVLNATQQQQLHLSQVSSSDASDTLNTSRRSIDPEPSQETSIFAMMGTEYHFDDDERGYLRGIDMSEEVAMTLLDTSLLSVSSEQRGSASTTSTPSRRPLVAATTPQVLLQEWQRQDDDVLSSVANHDDDEAEDVNDSNGLVTPPEALPPEAPFNVFRQNSTDIELQESQVYLERIAELENALHKAHQRAESEYRLRVEAQAAREQLQERLRRQEDSEVPPDVLWERNKTLVREVRFADQTCVELSGQKLALEKEALLLKEQLDHERHENSALLEKLNEANRTAAKADATSEALQKQLEQLESNYESLRTRNEDAHAEELQGMNDRLVKKEEEIDRLEMELDETKAECSKVSAQCSALQERLDESEDARRNLSELSLEQKEQLAKTNEERERLQEKLANSLRVVGELTGELEKARADLSTSQARFEDIEHEATELAEQNAGLSSKLDAALSDVERLNGEIGDAIYDKARLEDECYRFEQELEESREALVGASAECGSLADRLAEMETARSSIESNLRTQLQSADEETRIFKEELAASRQETEGLLSTLDELRVARAAAMDESSGRGDRISSLEAEIAALSSESERLQEDLAAAEERLSRANAELEKVRQVTLEYQEKVTLEYQERLTSTESMLSGAQEELRLLRNEYQQSIPRLAESVRKAVLGMGTEAEALEAAMARSSGEMAARIAQVATALKFIKESIEFEVESERIVASRDGAVSTLTGNSADVYLPDEILGSTPGQHSQAQVLDGSENGDLMNATFHSGCDRSSDLELMEEARVDLARDTSGIVHEIGSHAVSDVTDEDEESYSTIAGLSHLYSEEAPTDLSISLSRDHGASTDHVARRSPDPETAGREFATKRFPTVAQGRPAIEELERRIISLTAELSAMERTLSTVTSQRDAFQYETDGLRARVEELDDLLRAKSDQLGEATETCRKLEGELRALRGTNQLSSLEHDSLRNELAGKLAEASVAAEELRNFRETVERLYPHDPESQTECVSALDRVKALYECNKTLSDERDALLEQARKASAELDAVMQECETLRASSQAAEEEKAELRGQVDALINGMETLSHEHSRLQELLNQVTQEKEEAADARDQSVIDCEQALDLAKSVGGEVVTLRIQMQELEQEKGLLIEQASRDHKEKQDLTTKVERLEAQHEQTEARIQSLSAECESLRDQLHALQEKSSQAEYLLTETKEELSLSKQVCDRQRASISLLEDEAKQAVALKGAVAQLEADKENVDSQLLALQSQFSETQQALDDSYGGLKQEREANDCLQKELLSLGRDKQRLEQELRDKTNELLQAQLKSNNLQTDLRSTWEHARSLDEKLASSQAALSQLQGAYVAGNERLARLEQDKTELEVAAAESKAACKAAEDLAQYGEERLMQAQRELEDVRQRLVEAENARELFMRRWRAAQEESASLEMRLAETESDLVARTSEKEAAAQTIAEVRERLVVVHTEVERLRDADKALEKTNDEKNALLARLADREGELQRLTDKLASVERELTSCQAMVRLRETQEQELRESNEALLTKNRRLREHVLKMQEKCDEWEVYCEEQAIYVEKMRAANEATKRKVLEIAQMYRQRDEIYQVEREIWSTERSNWHANYSRLEGELDEIADELNVSRPGDVRRP